MKTANSWLTIFGKTKSRTASELFLPEPSVSMKMEERRTFLMTRLMNDYQSKLPRLAWKRSAMIRLFVRQTAFVPDYRASVCVLEQTTPIFLLSKNTREEHGRSLHVQIIYFSFQSLWSALLSTFRNYSFQLHQNIMNFDDCRRTDYSATKRYESTIIIV